jgi:antigen flippase
MITARLLGPAGRGTFAATTSWVGLAATFGTLSLGQVLLHHVAGKPSEEWLAETAGTALATTAAVTLVGWIAIAVLYATTGGRMFNHISPLLLALAFAALPFMIWMDTGRYLLLALDALSTANWAQIGGAVTTLTAIVLLVGIARLGVAGAVGAATIATACVATVMGAAVLRRTPRLDVSTPLLKQLLRGSSQLHLNAIGTYLFTQASVLVLNYYQPPEQTGYYQLAMQLFSMTLILSMSMGTVSFGLVAKRGVNEAWPDQRRLLVQSAGMIAVVSAIGYWLAPLGIRLVAGDRFLPAVPLFRTVLPALLGATFSTIMASQWIGRGLFRQAAGFTIAVGILSLALDLALVPHYGARGALVSTLATYAISVIGNGVMAVWVQGKWRQSRVAA